MIYEIVRYVIRLDIPVWLEQVTAEREKARQSRFYGDAIRKYYEEMGSLIEKFYGPFLHFVPYTLLGIPASTRSEALIALHMHFARLLRLQPGRKALELGCGHGRVGSWLARYTGADVTGITLGESEVRAANERGLPNHRVRLGDFHDLSGFHGQDDRMDAICAVYCLKYSTDLERVFGEIREALSPGGVFLSYDIWLNDNYDETCDEHRRIHANICDSTCMPPLQRLTDVVAKAEKSGLRLIYDVDLANPGNHWYRQFLEGHILHFLNSRVVAFLVRLAGGFRKGLPEFYEEFVVHPTTDFVKAGELGILDASRVLLFQRADE